MCHKRYEARSGCYCPECKTERKNEIKRLSYCRCKATDPEYAQKRNARAKERYAGQPEVREQRAEYRRQWESANRQKVRGYQLKYHYADPEKARKKRERQKLRQYGLTIESYQAMQDSQNGVCAICREPCPTGRRLAVDHDSLTGKVRGLLCTNCNQGIGKFKHDPERLVIAAQYLQSLGLVA